MTGETCRHCGGRIEYVETDLDRLDVDWGGWWEHVGPVPAWPAHAAAPAFGGGS